ncbi:threonine dehydratase [Saccharopolyspora erythraea NRRL 2338]|uniref:L-threonine dehydratase catabolic TdcB n=2 Tax=Saccharopolyspora erythraea TaxID=1836 RepID=A4F863_SACEN|nr:threonine ammonia-lyase [Saccharopolyspora erythraea]EQD84969.1 threonine dehydratase [Saccharopolyspora erythraea D]PFG94032.1 threonine dehydratase [Saccharopolyspora erythraea NRRL 2338]QRK90836.1 threonine ammonia-lyase [Saccharopolyspora erythraea]CAM00238.1 putative threonine dehydratase [Saccharopolyspora erythraea NRRL 2338]
MRLVGLDRIRAAGEKLEGIARRTPLEHSRVLGEACRGEVHLKCENLQRTGSFKLRGGYVRLAGLDAGRRATGVVAASAGNHAQGVALAASLLGIRSTVFMPERAPLPKVAATKAYGAEVRLHGAVLGEALEAARAHADATGAEFIHPFDHPDIIAGQGTVGTEILEQLPDVRTVVVPAGGGGLVSGIAAAVKAEHPQVRVLAVQAEQAAAWPPSLAAGKPVALLDTQRTMADGIAVPAPSELTFAHVSELVDDVLTVGEEALSRALLLCLERAKLVVEPAGVAAVAGLLEHPEQFGSPTAVVLSGGNIDPLLMLQLIQHGMTSAGRYLSLRVRLPDRPGSLAGLLARLGALSANVIDIEHSRIAGALALGEVDVEISLETRGPEHREQVFSELEAAGFVVVARR